MSKLIFIIAHREVLFIKYVMKPVFYMYCTTQPHNKITLFYVPNVWIKALIQLYGRTIYYFMNINCIFFNKSLIKFVCLLSVEKDDWPTNATCLRHGPSIPMPPWYLRFHSKVIIYKDKKTVAGIHKIWKLKEKLHTWLLNSLALSCSNTPILY